MSALLPLLLPLVVLGGLAGMVAALPPAGCDEFVPALGVGDVLAPGELLLGTVWDGVLVAPAVPDALPAVCPLASPNTANDAMNARDVRADFFERIGYSSEMEV